MNSLTKLTNTNMTEYLMHAIYWDIGVKRCWHNAKPTKKYINECARLGLPLPHARVTITAESVQEAFAKLEQTYGYKTKNCQAQSPMQLNGN